MKQLKTSAALAAVLSLGACTTANGGTAVNRTLIGSGVGAAIGAVIGHAAGGDAFGGAAAGAIAGGAAGAMMKPRSEEPTQWYRDSRGYCYYIDQHGRPVYDETVNC